MLPVAARASQRWETAFLRWLTWCAGAVVGDGWCRMGQARHGKKIQEEEGIVECSEQ